MPFSKKIINNNRKKRVNINQSEIQFKYLEKVVIIIKEINIKKQNK